MVNSSTEIPAMAAMYSRSPGIRVPILLNSQAPPHLAQTWKVWGVSPWNAR